MAQPASSNSNNLDQHLLQQTSPTYSRTNLSRIEEHEEQPSIVSVSSKSHVLPIDQYHSMRGVPSSQLSANNQSDSAFTQAQDGIKESMWTLQYKANKSPANYVLPAFTGGVASAISTLAPCIIHNHCESTGYDLTVVAVGAVVGIVFQGISVCFYAYCSNKAIEKQNDVITRRSISWNKTEQLRLQIEIEANKQRTEREQQKTQQEKHDQALVLIDKKHKKAMELQREQQKTLRLRLKLEGSNANDRSKQIIDDNKDDIKKPNSSKLLASKQHQKSKLTEKAIVSNVKQSKTMQATYEKSKNLEADDHSDE